MNVPIKYISSSGHEHDLISNGILHKTANYHRWAWEIEGTRLQYGYRVSDFSREPAVYETELIFAGSYMQRRAKINALHDDFEYDVRTKQPGKLIWGDYYINCFIVESETEPYENETWTVNKVSFYAPYPFWVQDFFVSLPPSENATSPFLDFPYDFPYDFTSPVMGSRNIRTDFPFASDFKMVIFGEAVNPRVVINDYPYVLYTTIPFGSYVVIDSRAKTVMMYGSRGQKTNMFDFRNKSQSVFEKITGGDLQIVWDASFGVDLTIYHERSEPRVEVIT